MAIGKKFKKAIAEIDREKRYLVADGAKLLMSCLLYTSDAADE